MSWSDDARESKSGTSGRTAGDPVQPCVERAEIEAVVDFDEPVALEIGLAVPETPVLESAVEHAEPPVVESTLEVADLPKPAIPEPRPSPEADGEPTADEED